MYSQQNVFVEPLIDTSYEDDVLMVKGQQIYYTSFNNVEVIARYSTRGRVWIIVMSTYEQITQALMINSFVYVRRNSIKKRHVSLSKLQHNDLNIVSKNTHQNAVIVPDACHAHKIKRMWKINCSIYTLPDSYPLK